MDQVTLAGTGLRVSRFVFGTASLFNAGPRANRLALLESAIDHGFTHFDTAPYYGFGWAERDLGAVLAHHPTVTVTTKVGLYSAGGENQPQFSVLFRKAAGRLFNSLSKPALDFAIERARRSLTGSLERLKTEHVAAFMLHEPELGLVATDEWQRWLESEVKSGRVGVFGLALTAEKLPPFLEKAPGLAPLIQVFDSLQRREADVLAAHGRPMQITYGYVSGARASRSTLPVADILRGGLARNPEGALIVSTTRVARLAQYGQLVAPHR